MIYVFNCININNWTVFCKIETAVGILKRQKGRQINMQLNHAIV